MAVRLSAVLLAIGLICAAPARSGSAPDILEACAAEYEESSVGALVNCIDARNAAVEKALQQLWPAVLSLTPPEGRKPLRQRQETWHADKLARCAQARRETESEGPTIAIMAKSLCLYRTNLEHLAEFNRTLLRRAKD